MGRSRAAWFLQDDDPNNRAKRRKTSSSAETPSTGMSEEKVGLFHCNYCNKDISGRIRLKCAVCPDYDLCDNLYFPLICPDWNAVEEMVLLEGIGMYGFGNWNEVAEYVGTKSKWQCIEHCNAVYINSPFFPLFLTCHVLWERAERSSLQWLKSLVESRKSLLHLGSLHRKTILRQLEPN